MLESLFCLNALKACFRTFDFKSSIDEASAPIYEKSIENDFLLIFHWMSQNDKEKKVFTISRDFASCPGLTLVQ